MVSVGGSRASPAGAAPCADVSLEGVRGSIPILAVTGYDQLYVRRELHDAGFIGILRKLIAYPDLIRAVAALAESAGSEP